VRLRTRWPGPLKTAVTGQSISIAPRAINLTVPSRWTGSPARRIDPPDCAHLATPLLIDLIVSHSDGWFSYLLEGPGPRGAEVLADLDSSVQPGFVYRPSDR